MVVVAIIGLLMRVATVGISHAIEASRLRVCLLNMEAIDSAKSLWGLENKKGDNDAPTEDDLKPRLKDKTFPSCPKGGTDAVNALSMHAACSVHPASATRGHARHHPINGADVLMRAGGVPAAAEGAVELHDGEQLVELKLHQ